MSDEWFQKIEEALIKSDRFSSLLERFSFPWEEASKRVAQALNFPDLKLSARPAKIQSQEMALSGMGAEPITLYLELSPLSGQIQWIMSMEDVAYITSLSLATDHGHTFSDPRFQEGFYRFLAIEALSAIDEMRVLKETSPRLMNNALPTAENVVVTEVSLALPNKTLYGRLVCPENFLTAFNAHLPSQPTPLLSREDIKKEELSLRMEVGGVSLAPEVWEKVAVGDCLVLDHCSYDPQMEKGSVMFFLDDVPILRGRLKPEGIKVLDYTPHTSEEIPATSLLLSIELGRLSITLEKLISLETGSLIDLSLPQDVAISLKGKKVARGEFLKVGETIGVRLLDIAS